MADETRAEARAALVDLRDAVVGWDIGGAHLKACLTRRGRVLDVAQWACPLWQGIAQLDQALQRAARRWPTLAGARHAVTMTGEMADLFEHREDGVRRIANCVLSHWPAERVHFYAGGDDWPGDDGWCHADAIDRRWPRIASANWLAMAQMVATHARPTGSQVVATGVLVDIGSTTTDMIAFGGGRVMTDARSDAERLASGELIYHGVVRTPLCAVAQRIAFDGVERHVMNELFATSADVYRLTGELDADNDLQPSADQAPKDTAATCQRLARMIGLDARDAEPARWLAFARAWRTCQIALWRDALRRVVARHDLPAQAVVIGAGCGDFLVRELAAHPPGSASTAAPTCIDFARWVAPDAGPLAARIGLCAPSVAVALLFARRRG